MKIKGLRKELGRCTIEVNDDMHEFPKDVHLHLQKEEIYAEVRRLRTQMDSYENVVS